MHHNNAPPSVSICFTNVNMFEFSKAVRLSVFLSPGYIIAVLLRRPLQLSSVSLHQVSAKCTWHLRALVHLFVDALDRQLDVVLDAVEDVFEVSLLVHIELQ